MHDPAKVGPKRPPSRIQYQDLVLQPLSCAHAREMVTLIDTSLPELRRYMNWAHFPQTRDSQYERLCRVQSDYWSGKDYGMGIFDARTGCLLGSTGMHRRTLNPHGYEIGYWVATPHAGKGIATTATRMQIALLFAHFASERVQNSTNERNIGSQRVIEKYGFIPEATLKNFVLAKPTPEMIAQGWDCTPLERLYALTPEDRSRLDWYDSVSKGLRIWNFEGTELNARPAQ